MAVALILTLATGAALAACGGDDSGERIRESPRTPTTPTTALPPNAPLCTETTLGAPRADVAALAGDCDTLLAIKSVFEGTAGINWHADTPLTIWHGISVGGEPPRVTKILIWGAVLSGVLPTQLGNLTALTELDLHDNALQGVLPTQLGNLTALTTLSLSGNDLTGVIPTQLGNLTALTNLCISGNVFRGYIPTQLGNLTALTSLCLNENALSGAIPAQLGNLVMLRVLVLSGNTLSGSIPRELERLEHLELLGMAGGNSLTGCVPGRLRDVPENDLEWLELPDC